MVPVYFRAKPAFKELILQAAADRKQDLSVFLREVVAEGLRRRGYKFEEDVGLRESRKGKGGPQPDRLRSACLALNDRPSSNPECPAVVLESVAYARRKARGSGKTPPKP